VNLLKEVSRTKEGTPNCCGHKFRGTVFNKSVQLYELWHDFQGRLWWDKFCAVSGFLLAGNVLFLLICTFLKPNNKYLSHWVSPPWGFP
jgi:hypothetical protein